MGMKCGQDMEKLTFVHKMMGKRGRVQNDFRMVMKICGARLNEEFSLQLMCKTVMNKNLHFKQLLRVDFCKTQLRLIKMAEIYSSPEAYFITGD